MAGGLLRKLLEDAKVRNVEVRSAGVLTVTGLRASQEARQILESMEVDISRHRSSQLSPEMIRRADLILGMTPYHVQRAVRISEDARLKTYLFKEYTRSDLANIQIADPMGGTLEVFKQRMKEIRKACELLVKTPFVSGASDDIAPPAMAAHDAAARRYAAPAERAAAQPEPKAAVKAKPAAKLAAKAPAKPAAKAKAAAKPARKPAAKAKPAKSAGKSKRPLAQARASAARISRAARLRAAKSKSPLRKLAGRAGSKVKGSPKNLSRR